MFQMVEHAPPELAGRSADSKNGLRGFEALEAQLWRRSAAVSYVRAHAAMCVW